MYFMCMCVYVLWVWVLQGILIFVEIQLGFVIELGCLRVLYLFVKSDIKSGDIFFKGNFLIVDMVF